MELEVKQLGNVIELTAIKRILIQTQYYLILENLPCRYVFKKFCSRTISAQCVRLTIKVPFKFFLIYWSMNRILEQLLHCKNTLTGNDDKKSPLDLIQQRPGRLEKNRQYSNFDQLFMFCNFASIQWLFSKLWHELNCKACEVIESN